MPIIIEDNIPIPQLGVGRKRSLPYAQLQIRQSFWYPNSWVNVSEMGRLTGWEFVSRKEIAAAAGRRVWRGLSPNQANSQFSMARKYHRSRRL